MMSGWRSLLGVVTIVALFGLIACAESDDGNTDGDAQTDGDAESDSDLTTDGDIPADGDTPTDGDDSSLDLPDSTGNATADRMIAAALACGAQNHRTVPMDWDMVAIGEGGCTGYAPPGWIAYGAGTAVTIINEEESGLTGFLSMGGVPNLGVQMTCTPAGAAQYLTDQFTATGCVNPKTLYLEEYTFDFLGLPIPAAHYFYGCTADNVYKVGYFWVSIHGTDPLCEMLVMGLWMPETQIEQKMCTLTQIFNSVQCPSGSSGCDESACAQECQGKGLENSFCGTDDQCYCE